MKKTLLSIALLPILLNAQVLLDETFEYSNFETASSWTTTGSVTAPNTGRTVDYTPVLAYKTGVDSYVLSETGKTMTNDYKSETTNYLSGRAFTDTPISQSSSNNKIYLSFLYKVKSQGGTQSEILGITDALNNVSSVKLWYGKGTSTSTFKLGITRSSGASASIQWYNPSVALDAAATYLIVIKYDFANETASFFVNPAINSSIEPSASAFDDGTVNLVTTVKSSLSHLLLRGNGSNASYYYMGGLRVSQSWSDAVASAVSLPALAAPQINEAADLTSSSFRASWTPVENALGYDIEIYWGLDKFKTISISGQSESQLMVTDLIPDRKFRYKVVAKGDRTNYSNSSPSTISPEFQTFIATTRKSKLKIILKLDDLQSKGGTCAAIPVLDFLKNKQVKAGFGAIAIKFDAGATPILKPYFEIKDDKGNQLFELWNHGLEHVTDEFSGTDYAYQKSHFDQGTQIMKNLLDIQMHSFGTPYNSSDATTNTVMSEDPEYKVFLLGSTSPASSTGIINLTKRVNMESATGNPEYSYFVTNYNAKKDSYTEYMILQGHPNQWTEAETGEVNQIIHFLAAEGCEFVLPYEYYLSLTLDPPTNLTFVKDNSNNVKLSWTDNSISEYNFNIEGSLDANNWKSIASISANTTEYIVNDEQLLENKYFRVCASCGIKSNYSNIVENNEIVNAVRKLESNPKSTLNIYPIPCKDKLYVDYSLPASEIISCDIINLSGVSQKQIFINNSIQNSKIECNILNLAKGIYFFRLQSEHEILMKKFVVD
ncbi:MAG: T9SS type A sorting domain-containing protein [Ignavibacteriaceae bacterium]|jgi:hypothetical protein|nr:T9SS type A sorting domain-containing protein [Ignavibacteriaceae bacterium]